MANIFTTQDKLRIQLKTETDITGATELLIKYKKPDGTAGQFTAASSDDTNGYIYYDLTTDEFLDANGKWTFWAYVTFSDGRSAPGDKVQQYIGVEGK